MGGEDIYSGSKGAAELIIKSYYHSFFKTVNCNVKFAIAREVTLSVVGIGQRIEL